MADGLQVLIKYFNIAHINKHHDELENKIETDVKHFLNQETGDKILNKLEELRKKNLDEFLKNDNIINDLSNFKSFRFDDQKKRRRYLPLPLFPSFDETITKMPHFSFLIEIRDNDHQLFELLVICNEFLNREQIHLIQ